MNYSKGTDENLDMLIRKMLSVNSEVMKIERCHTGHDKLLPQLSKHRVRSRGKVISGLWT